MARQKMRFARPHSRLDLRVFKGESGVPYLVFKTPEKNKGGSAFHVFAEVEAKDAARECGATGAGNTRKFWATLWEQTNG